MTGALRLGVVLTHPVQYYAPLFRRLSARTDVDLTVLFAHRPGAAEQGWEFGVPFEWDVDLTSGYRHEWLVNRARRPSASTFEGCDTPEIADAIASRRFDAVLVMGWHARTYWQAMRACWRGRVPVLVRGDSQLVDDSPVRRLAKRAAYPRFMRRFAACLSVGTRSTEYFRYYGARRVVASPHFVDNAYFASRADELAPHRDELRAQWGLAPEAFVVVFSGKLIARKQPIDAIRAVARSGRDDVCILFAGDGELRAACEQEAARLGVAARFAGFLNQSRIAEAYVAADALILPSTQETWGLVVNEAMACGRPVLVSTAAGCAPDLVADGETGFVFAPGDVGRMGALIRDLAADRPRARALGDAARRRIAEFNVDAAAEGIVQAASSSVGAR